MRLVDNARLAVARLGHRPVRSFLLLQGTIWGVAVALFPVAVLEGTRRTVLERGAEVGGDRITIAADPTGIDPEPLTPADVEAVRRALAAAGTPALAAAGFTVTRPAAPGALVPDAVLLGPPETSDARGLRLAAGRLPRPGEGAPEVAVEGRLAEELARANGGTAVGASLPLFDGRTARVVGAFEARPPLARRTNDLGFDTEHRVFQGLTGRLLAQLGMPLGDDAWKRTDRCAYAVGEGSAVDWILLRVAPGDLRAAAKAADRVLHDRGRDVVVLYPPVYPLVVGRELDRFRTVSLALFLACLVMGGVVMANVGLLAALRRSEEVAIHRVEGATQGDVAAQWLAEGLVLSAVGAVVGCLLACGLAEVRVAFEPLSGMRWAFPWKEAAVACLVAVAVGGLAQLLPALRAARQDPVEALVDE